MSKQQTPKSLPFFFVGKSVTATRKDNYLSAKYPLLSDALGREDTKSIWYSREHIATLLDEIDLAEGDGLRLYFGAYEATSEFAGQLCIVMNVTRVQVIDGAPRHIDVVWEDEPNFASRSISNPSPSNSNTRPKDYNFGSPCPPRCT